MKKSGGVFTTSSSSSSSSLGKQQQQQPVINEQQHPQQQQHQQQQHPTTCTINGHTTTTTTTTNERRQQTAPPPLKRPYQVQTPTKYRQPILSQNDEQLHTIPSTLANYGDDDDDDDNLPRSSSSKYTTTAAATTTDTLSPLGMMGTSRGVPVSSSSAGITHHHYTSTTTPTPNTTNSTAHSKSKRNKFRKQQQQKNRDFQQWNDMSTVRIRHVNIQQRSIFNTTTTTTTTTSENSVPVSSSTNNYYYYDYSTYLDCIQHCKLRKVSPTPNYRILLQHVYYNSSTLLRQLQYSPSTDRKSDRLYRLLSSSERQQKKRHSEASSSQRDGRYRIHDQLYEIGISTTPNNVTPPPVLYKTRLPCRADVGFANATEQQIQQKQYEIQIETLHEEAKPRLLSKCGMTDIVCEHATSIPFAGVELQANDRNSSTAADPYSMLAPPLDATYSPSEGYRPGTAHDRPGTMQYVLACCSSIDLKHHHSTDAADATYRASMTLYTLPPVYRNHSSTTASAAAAYHIQRKQIRHAESTTTLAYGKISEEFWFPVEEKGGTLRKGIFGYIPQDLSMEGGNSSNSKRHTTNNNNNSSSDDTAAPASPQPSSLYIVLQVYKVVKTSITVTSSSAAKDMTSTSSSNLLQPVCFGITKFFRPCEMDWPDCNCKEIQLYKRPASQSTFLERLWTIVHRKTTDLDDSSSSTSRKSKKLSSDDVRNSSSAPINNEPCDDCRAVLHLSALGTDFLQAMLTCPASLSSRTIREQPKLLVDCTGNSAILLEDAAAGDDERRVDTVVSGTSHNKKRSNLMRLPCLAEGPSGYTTSAEFREVLYLPARPKKRYDVDGTHGFYGSTSLLNHLYLFPRLFRSTSSSRTTILGQVVIRIRILHGDDDDESESGSPLHPVRCFHSTAPWSTDVLQDEAFTKLPPHNNTGLSLNDEIKIQLPDVLDGLYQIEFTLLGSNNTPSLLSIARALVPLSSSSSTTTTTNSSATNSKVSGRVATIIPNGKHRLELGKFQLQLETRLVSALHVGDAGVAAALRDLPTPKQWQPAKSPTTVVSRSMSASSSTFDLSEDFAYSLLSSASEGTLRGCFRALFIVHMANLIKGVVASPGVHSKIVLRSLLQLLTKVKLEQSTEQVSIFCKTQVDRFDEGIISLAADEEKNQQIDDEILEDTVLHFGNKHGLEMEVEVEAIDEMKDDLSVRFREKDTIRSRREVREARVRAAMGKTSLPFSRVANGASKMHLMKVEAERRQGQFSPFFDDDETIATAPSLYNSGRRLGAMTFTFDEDNDASIKQHHDILHSLSSIRSTNISITSTTPTKTDPRTAGAAELARKMRTAAQVLLAPCVGPAFSSKTTSFRTQVMKQDDNGIVEKVTAFLCSPGSDDEGDENRRRIDTSDNSSHCWTSFRSASVQNALTYSVEDEEGAGKAQYLYETILGVWMNEASFNSDPHPEHQISSQYFDHLDLLLPLCLKSMSLRCGRILSNSRTPMSKILLDQKHVSILESLMKVLGKGMLEQVNKYTSSMDLQAAISKSLQKADLVLDFIIALFAIIHSEHMNCFIGTYFSSLREEFDHVSKKSVSIWPPDMVQRWQYCCQLRLHAVERLVCLPSFVALNFPAKYGKPADVIRLNSSQLTWLEQQKKNTQQTSEYFSALQDGTEKLPRHGWLSHLTIRDCLTICGQASEAIVAAGSIESARATDDQSPNDLDGEGSNVVAYQSIALHSITVVYDLIIRRHGADSRFKSETAKSRVAALIAIPLFDMTVDSVRWIAKFPPENKVRCLWLLSFSCILQEAPEVLIQDFVRSTFREDPQRMKSFLNAFRLCCTSFFKLSDIGSHSDGVKFKNCPWWLQESFNTICAAVNLVAEAVVFPLTENPVYQISMLTDVLLVSFDVLSMPQSPVTQLRCIGGALHILEHLGVSFFLDAVGSTTLQHWIRILLSLMNSTSLSVRSIAIDFVVSLLCGIFDLSGSIDSVSIIFATVLPEVAAREIGLFAMRGLVSEFEHIARALWPLRRSIADLEDSNPLDDDRVDTKLVPVLSIFCRACQALLDGVIVECRLRGKAGKLSIMGMPEISNVSSSVLEADEESVFEAASFFQPETGFMQKLRWLLTLAQLQETKHRWIEAAEALFLSAKLICDAMPFIHDVWRPVRFSRWYEDHLPPCLNSLDGSQNIVVTDSMKSFAHSFLEPSSFLTVSLGSSVSSFKLPQPTVAVLCALLNQITEKAVDMHQFEAGMESLVYSKLELLMNDVICMVARVNADSYSTLRGSGSSPHRSYSMSAKLRAREDTAALRQATANVGGIMSKVMKRIVASSGDSQQNSLISASMFTVDDSLARLQFACIKLSGAVPTKFQESPTSIPFFLQWDKPCIIRVQQQMMQSEKHKLLNNSSPSLFLERVVAESFVKTLTDECGCKKLVVRTGRDILNKGSNETSDKTYLDVVEVFPGGDGGSSSSSMMTTGYSTDIGSNRHFYYRGARNGTSSPLGGGGGSGAVVDLTVAHAFPGSLSRQNSLLTAELVVMPSSPLPATREEEELNAIPSSTQAA